jgi:uncharacterized membrane protein (UPF0127 family)
VKLDTHRGGINFGRYLAGVLLVFTMAWGFTGGTAVRASDRLRSDTVELAVVDHRGETLTTVRAFVSSTPIERYLGLSGTDRLDTGTGMWFEYPDADTRSFVMRDMRYPLDIVFVGDDGRINRIKSAPVESPPLTKYMGWARWVLEVNAGWARRHGVTAGDSVAVLGRSRID